MGIAPGTGGPGRPGGAVRHHALEEVEPQAQASKIFIKIVKAQDMPCGILNGDFKMFRVSGRCGNDEANRVALEVRTDSLDGQFPCGMRVLPNGAERAAAE